MIIMADTTDAGQRRQCCTCHPDFAVVCFFIQKFGDYLGLYKLNIKNLQNAFESKDAEAPVLLRDLLIYLLRRIKRNVNEEKWERSLSSFYGLYSEFDAWELEQVGFSRLKLSTKLALLRTLLEAQFDGNVKFRETVVAEVAEESMRLQPYGRDRRGLCYWLLQDEELTVHIYREEQDDCDGSTWEPVVKERDDLPLLINLLVNDKSTSTNLSSRSETPLGSESMQSDCNDDQPLIKHLNMSLDSQSISVQEEIKLETKQEILVEKQHAPETVIIKQECDRDPGFMAHPTIVPDHGDSIVKEVKCESLSEEKKEPLEPCSQQSVDSAADDQAAASPYEQTDEEDNIPLGQLRYSLQLMSQARKALEKARKDHEKKKFKEKLKQKKQHKRKNIPIKDICAPTVVDRRTSSRPKKPVCFQEEDDLLEDDSDFLLMDSDEEGYVPKGRNARRQAKRSGGIASAVVETDITEVVNDDTPCTLCGKFSQPQYILLCDKCDAGWHTTCLRPPLFFIPDGDWFCPSCEQTMLIDKLQLYLVELDNQVKLRESKKKRQERQEKHALINGINPGNIIVASEEMADKKISSRERKPRKLDDYEYDSWEEDATPYKRACRTRTKVSYRYEEFDELIDSAIKEDPILEQRTCGKDISNLMGEDTKRPPEPRKHPVSRGKDIMNIEGIQNLLGEEEKARTKRAPRTTRRLNDLDASDGDNDDADYSVSSPENEVLEDDDDIQSDVVSEEDNWRPSRTRQHGTKRQHTRRGRSSPADPFDFINDDDDDGSDTAPARRSTRTSAAAAQAALRNRGFGFTSSEDTESTPCSSSSEEELDGTRLRNKWNIKSVKTYGARPKKQKSKQKKRRRVIADYNSEQSTDEDQGDSEQEYIPPSLAKGSDDGGDVEKDNASEGSNEALRRAGHRIESSSETEELDDEGKTDTGKHEDQNSFNKKDRSSGVGQQNALPSPSKSVGIVHADRSPQQQEEATPVIEQKNVVHTHNQSADSAEQGHKPLSPLGNGLSRLSHSTLTATAAPPASTCASSDTQAQVSTVCLPATSSVELHSSSPLLNTAADKSEIKRKQTPKSKPPSKIKKLSKGEVLAQSTGNSPRATQAVNEQNLMLQQTMYPNNQQGYLAGQLNQGPPNQGPPIYSYAYQNTYPYQPYNQYNVQPSTSQYMHGQPIPQQQHPGYYGNYQQGVYNTPTHSMVEQSHDTSSWSQSTAHVAHPQSVHFSAAPNVPAAAMPATYMAPSRTQGFMMDNILQSGEYRSRSDDGCKAVLNEDEDDDEMSSYLTMASFVTGGDKST